ncbi:MAG: hypothetical protein ACTJHU_10935, partial [Mycetocola sp.]
NAERVGADAVARDAAAAAAAVEAEELVDADAPASGQEASSDAQATEAEAEADAGSSDGSSPSDATADTDGADDSNAASDGSGADADANTGTDPGTPNEPSPSTLLRVSDATFTWGINNESNGGAYFGGCNFLTAGRAGDSGSPRVWSESDGFYRASQGNVRIVKPASSGSGTVTASWASKCQTPSGATINGKATNAADSYSQSQVEIVGGTGTVDPSANTARIRWSGSFTVVYYGGMTYWTATDPVLTVNKNGKGTVTATLSGYKADMDDPSIWGTLAPRTVTLATLDRVTVTKDGSVTTNGQPILVSNGATSSRTLTPDYLGVSIPSDVAGRNPQDDRTSTNSSWWGAFPSDFLQFQMETGQSSYWFTTAGGANSIQPRKVALPISIGVGTTSPVGGYLPASIRSAADVSAAITAGTITDVTSTTQGIPKKLTTATPLTLRQPVSWGSEGDDDGASAAAGGDDSSSSLEVEVWHVGSRTLEAVETAFDGGPLSYSLPAYSLPSGTGYLLAVTEHGITAASLTPATAPVPDGGSNGGTGGSNGSGDSGGSTGSTVKASGAVFDWGINHESTGGAYFGGCNFLSAGVAGDTGSARVWTANDRLYQASSGNTHIVQTNSRGDLVEPGWDDRCSTPSGTSVNGKTTNAPDSYTGSRVRIENGEGTFNPEDNTATVRWTGSFTVAYYGGMSYWSASNPELTVESDGTGVVTATLSGFAADMDDLSKWGALAPRKVVIANLSNVTVTDDTFTVTPDFLGVSIPRDVAGRNAQVERSSTNASWWGSFPADFLRFQSLTGQSSYWFTTAGSQNSIQPRKAALPLTVCATAECVAPKATGGVTGDDLQLDNTALTPPTAVAAPTRLAAAVTSTATAAIAAAAPLAATAGAVVTEIILRAPAVLASAGAEYAVLALLLVLIAALGGVVVLTAAGGAILLTSLARGAGTAGPPSGPAPAAAVTPEAASAATGSAASSGGQGAGSGTTSAATSTGGPE